MWVPAAAALAGVLAFLPSLRVGLLADDLPQFRRLPSLSGPLDAFTLSVSGSQSTGPFYRPLWMGLDRVLFGYWGGNAVFYHAWELVLYAALIVQVWRLAGRFARWISPGVAAAAFALYPQHHESVAWYAAVGDLLAWNLCLAALLLASARRPGPGRLVGAAALALAGALCKETAYVVAPLLLLYLLTQRRLEGKLPARWGIGPLVLAAAQAPALAARTLVLHGLGGYHVPFSVLRLLWAALSYVLGCLTPPPLDPVTQPLLVLVPLAIVAVLTLGVLRGPVPQRRVIAVFGVGWFVVGILPVVNYPLNPSTGNGHRYLLMPSIGLALVVAAAAGTVNGRRVVGALAAATAALVCCLSVTLQWVDATAILGSEAAALQGQPRGGSVVLATFVEDYRMARVSTDGAEPVLTAGRGDLTVASCVPVHLLERRSNEVTVARGPVGLEARTTRAAPFRVSVLSLGRTFPACAYHPAPTATTPLGTTLAAIGTPARATPSDVVLYWDGRDMRRCCP
ncbi:MAG: hypothetical protein ABR598_01195 [Candidatus Dormibacteria bacterium]